MSVCASCQDDPCRCAPFTQLKGLAIGSTLVASLTCVVDSARDIATCLGARPYEVALVWTRWSGLERGIGVEEVVRRDVLLPTPLIGDLTALSAALQPIGVEEVGSITVTEISPRFTEDYLCGRADDGTPIPDEESFYWEVTFNRPDGPGPRRRFALRSAPTLQATDAQWVVSLVRASEDRTRAGAVR